MFGREAAVKHTLLESENPKYLGRNDGMINVGLMAKLYNVVAHNLNEARKARDGKKKGITPKEPEKLKIGDNILVRDHTSKAFQPKYKDFCIVGWDIAETQLIQKNQKESNLTMTLPLQTLVMTIILVIAILKQTITQINKIAKRAVQAMENTIKEASHNKLLRNIKDFHRTTMLVTIIVTNTTNCTNHSGQAQINNRNTQKSPGMQKLNNEYDKSYQSLTSRTHSYCDS